jgi:beta-galactosidase GanA
MGDLVPAHIDHHSIIFLFVYDVWVDLWGQSFADEQVTFERARSGSIANYDKLWTEALAMTPAERAGRFKQFVQEHRK